MFLAWAEAAELGTLDGRIRMTPQARAMAWLSAPIVIAVIGVAWMYLAVAHYERITRRKFYGLAAQQYSVPEWQTVYHPGGQSIERWTVNVPSVAIVVTLGLLLLATLVGEWRHRRLGWITGCLLWYGLVSRFLRGRVLGIVQRHGGLHLISGLWEPSNSGLQPTRSAAFLTPELCP